MTDALKTTAPTEGNLRERARTLMRACLQDAGQVVDEGVVCRQAEKIVRSMWPIVQRAWADAP